MQKSHTTRGFFITIAVAASQVCQAAQGSADPPRDLARLSEEIAKMADGGWHEIPGTEIPLLKVSDIEAIEKTHGGGRIWGKNGSRAVLRAWNGAAHDPEHHVWYFFGGGHADYGGNEVYAFDFRSLSWSRLTDPSPLTGPNSARDPETRTCPLPAEGPPAYHTYDGIVWNPIARSVWVFGSVPYCLRGMAEDEPVAWEFDPRARKWRFHRINAPRRYAKTAWNPSTGRILVYAKGGGPYEVDSEGRIHRQGPKDGRLGGVGVMAFDPKRRKAFGVNHYGGKALFELPLDDATLGTGTELSNVSLPADLATQNVGQGGMAYHAGTDSFVLWPGGREVWSWTVETGEFRRFEDKSNNVPPGGEAIRVFSKWIYIPEVDVFAGVADSRSGVWLYKLPPRAERVDASKPRACRNGDCSYASVAAALTAAAHGDTVRIIAGKYRDGGVLRANGVKILAQGAHLYGAVMEGKASLVIKGNDTIIEGLECSDIRVASLNGACVRLEGQNLTLRNVRFHDSQSGILCGNQGHGRIVIEDSAFENMGVAPGEKANPHAIYIGTTDEFVLRRSRILSSRGEGHEVKSRARRNILEENIIASLDGADSRLIDLPNGGDVVIRRNVLEEGPNSVNHDVIAIGLERGKGHGADHSVNQSLIEENLIILDGSARVRLLNFRSVPSPIFRGNTVVGGPQLKEPGLSWFPDRRSAGLPPYPALPPVPEPVANIPK